MDKEARMKPLNKKGRVELSPTILMMPMFLSMTLGLIISLIVFPENIVIEKVPCYDRVGSLINDLSCDKEVNLNKDYQLFLWSVIILIAFAIQVIVIIKYV